MKFLKNKKFINTIKKKNIFIKLKIFLYIITRFFSKSVAKCDTCRLFNKNLKYYNSIFIVFHL